MDVVSGAMMGQVSKGERKKKEGDRKVTRGEV
jgi:hypothetical protein